MISIILSCVVLVVAITSCVVSHNSVKKMKKAELRLKAEHALSTDYFTTLYFINNIKWEYQIQKQGECMKILWYIDIADDIRIEFDMIFNSDESLKDYQIRKVELEK